MLYFATEFYCPSCNHDPVFTKVQKRQRKGTQTSVMNIWNIPSLSQWKCMKTSVYILQRRRVTHKKSSDKDDHTILTYIDKTHGFVALQVNAEAEKNFSCICVYFMLHFLFNFILVIYLHFLSSSKFINFHLIHPYIKMGQNFARKQRLTIV